MAAEISKCARLETVNLCIDGSGITKLGTQAQDFNLGGFSLLGTGFDLSNADLQLLNAYTSLGGVTLVEFQYINTLTSNVQTQINTNELLGTGNAAYIPLVLQSAYDPSDATNLTHSLYTAISVYSTATNPVFVFSFTGYPFNLGSLSLHVKSIRIYVSGDATNYVDRLRLNASKSDGTLTQGLIDDGTNIGAGGGESKTYTPGAAIDLDGYSNAWVYVNTAVNITGNLTILSYEIELFYA